MKPGDLVQRKTASGFAEDTDFEGLGLVTCRGWTGSWVWVLWPAVSAPVFMKVSSLEVPGADG